MKKKSVFEGKRSQSLEQIKTGITTRKDEKLNSYLTQFSGTSDGDSMILKVCTVQTNLLW